MRKSVSSSSLMESISTDSNGKSQKLAELELKRNRRRGKPIIKSSPRRRPGMNTSGKLRSLSLSRSSGTLVPRGKKELREYSKMRKSTDNLMAGFDFETTSSGKFKNLADKTTILDQKTGSPKKKTSKSPRPEVSPTLEEIPGISKTRKVPPLRMPRPPTSSKPEPSKSPEPSLKKRPLQVEIDENEELRLDKLRNSPFHRKSKNQLTDSMRHSKLDLLEQSQNLILPSPKNRRSGRLDEVEEDEEQYNNKKDKSKKKKKKKKKKTRKRRVDLSLDLESTPGTRDSLDDLFNSDAGDEEEEDVDIDDIFKDLTPKTRANKQKNNKKEKSVESTSNNIQASNKTRISTTTIRKHNITPRRDPIIDENRSKKRAELLNRTRLLLKRRREKKTEDITKAEFIPPTKKQENDLKLTLESKEKEEEEGEEDEEEEEEEIPQVLGNNVRFPRPPTEFVDSRRLRRRKIKNEDGEDSKMDDEDITDSDEEKEDEHLLGDGEDSSKATSRLSTVLQKKTFGSRIATSIGSIFTSTGITLAGLMVGMFGLRSTSDEIEAPKTRVLNEDDEEKRNKIRHMLPNGTELEALPDELDEEAEDRAQPQPLTCIEIVESGLIPGNSFVDHPLVCVHIVDSRTGEYLRKRTMHRGVVSAVECSTMFRIKGNTVERYPIHTPIIQPSMTSPAKFRRQPGTNYRAIWDHSLVYNLDIAEILQPHVLILFEFMDYGNTIPEKYIKRGNGFHRVAWAFLRTVNNRGEPIIGHKSRDLTLALYKYPNKGKVSSFVKMQAQSGRANIGDLAFVPDVFLLYRQRSRKRYPSTLTVRVMPYEARKEEEFVFSERRTRKARLPTDLEILPLKKPVSRSKSGESTVSTKEEETILDEKTEKISPSITTIMRKENEACKVPTRLYSRFEGGSLGNTALTFTPDGDHVVVACVEDTHCPIRVFDIHTKELCLELNGHMGIVHQLTWCHQKSKLLLCSASSDGTVMVWSMLENVSLSSSSKKRTSIGPTFVLPHPDSTFVYTVAVRPFSKRDEDLVCVSGAYDQELRLWSLTKGTFLGNIRKAAHAHHKSHINAVVFSERGRKMFSGDNFGILIVWRLNGASNRADSFEVLRQIKDNLPGHSINTIRLRASSVVKLDTITSVTSSPEIIVLAEGSILQAHETMSPNAVSKRFAGLVNTDLARKLSCVVSPDGRYLMAGSEDGNMYVWNTNTGEQVSHPAENVDCALLLNFKEAISDVAWCPTRHAVALCVMSSDVCADFGTSHPVLVYVASSDPFEA